MDSNIEDRFFSKVNYSDNCWNWTGYTDRYGVFKVGRATKKAHRWSYEYFIEEIPKDMCVLHHCDNPKCVNPFHLFIGTQQENVKDMMEKGRYVSGNSLKTQCPKGHEYNKDNTILVDGKNQKWRICKECAYERNRIAGRRRWKQRTKNN